MRLETELNLWPLPRPLPLHDLDGTRLMLGLRFGNGSSDDVASCVLIADLKRPRAWAFWNWLLPDDWPGREQGWCSR